MIFFGLLDTTCRREVLMYISGHLVSCFVFETNFTSRMLARVMLMLMTTVRMLMKMKKRNHNLRRELGEQRLLLVTMVTMVWMLSKKKRRSNLRRRELGEHRPILRVFFYLVGFA